ncbi:MAG: 50S ribosomal protein L31 [Anaerolineales bacterium]|nr:50S ribosomal protein L31 [Chloroflexota bacterium]MBL6983533.1 50S ribosomal protein L31 [Anaerolineales bacterium]
MKKDIHPTYFPEAVVTCACGNSWTTGSTQEAIRTDICSNCHPFYTGEQRIVDTEGQVDRFMKKLQARESHIADQKAQDDERLSPTRPIAELELGSRVEKALEEAGITEVGHAMEKLELGDAAILEIKGFGRKSLADLKKGLRRLGYELPEPEAIST